MSDDRNLWTVTPIPAGDASEYAERMQREGFSIAIIGESVDADYVRHIQRRMDAVDGSFGRETWWAITDAPWWRRAWDRATDPVRSAWWRLTRD